MLSEDEITTALRGLPGWQAAEVGGKPGISKTFRCGNFLSGLAFVTQVAVLAERAGHHPDVMLTYPSVTVSLTTHDAGGLSDKDFALAREIEKIE